MEMAPDEPMTWSPEQYERFKSERKQPFLDLLALVEKRPRMRVVDLGCGTGELTRELHEHARRARRRSASTTPRRCCSRPGSFGGEMLRFEKGDIEAFVTDEPFDLDLLERRAALGAGSRTALRAPDAIPLRRRPARRADARQRRPSVARHRRARGVAASASSRVPPYVLPAARYAELLHRLGYKHQHVRMQVYGHLLPSTDDVVEWVRGALLTHYEALLPADRYARVPRRLSRGAARGARRRAAVLLHVQARADVGKLLSC